MVWCELLIIPALAASWQGDETPRAAAESTEPKWRQQVRDWRAGLGAVGSLSCPT